MHKLVLIRHGESIWNQENRFTGWVDVDLTEKGCQEAYQAGIRLKEAGLTFDHAYTSVLKRAIRTLWQIQDAMDLMYMPTQAHWRLNERHYGALSGLNKTETAQKYGDEQVLIWRRSYNTRPPLSEPNSPKSSFDDPKYRAIPENERPLGECLADTVKRVIPIWNDTIAPAIQAGKKTLLVAHGNSLRALIKHLDQISDEEILHLNIPNAVPIVYELDKNLKPISNYFLTGN